METTAPTERKPSVWGRAIVFTAAVAFIALLAYGVFTAAPPKIEPGDELPEFDLPLLDGSGSMSSEDLRGHPVVINFFASWCLPCREEAPLLQDAYERYRDQGVIFLGVNMRDARSRAELFVDEFGITFPVVRDERLDLVTELGVFGLPETFFVDHESRFVDLIAQDAGGEERSGLVILGAIDETQLADNVEVLIRRAASPESPDN